MRSVIDGRDNSKVKANDFFVPIAISVCVIVFLILIGRYIVLPWYANGLIEGLRTDAFNGGKLSTDQRVALYSVVTSVANNYIACVSALLTFFLLLFTIREAKISESRYQNSLDDAREKSESDKLKYEKSLAEERKRHEESLAIGKVTLRRDKIDREKQEAHRLVENLSIQISDFRIYDDVNQEISSYSAVALALERLLVTPVEGREYDAEDMSMLTNRILRLSEIQNVAYMMLYFANHYEDESKLYASFLIGNNLAKSACLISASVVELVEFNRIPMLEAVILPETLAYFIRICTLFESEFQRFSSCSELLQSRQSD